MMSFEDFVKSGSVGVDLNIAIGQIQGTLPGATVHWIDAAEKSYGVFFQGVEILFWGGVLYSVQFEIANMEKLQIGRYTIDATTTCCAFKQMLDEMGLFFSESEYHGQKVLALQSGVKLYFDGSSQCFLTAMKTYT